MSQLRKSNKMLKTGTLVRHLEDEDLSSFGPGLVVDVFTVSVSCPWVAKVQWQRPINKILYPAGLFTIESLVTLSEQDEN
mgnify:CR=1 FL=1